MGVLPVKAVYFTAPYQVALRDERLPALPAGQVHVQTVVSAISPGTELLFYRGQAPAGMAVDETIPGLSGAIAYPLKYGYAAVDLFTCGDIDPWAGFDYLERVLQAERTESIEIPRGMVDKIQKFHPDDLGKIVYKAQGA